MGFGLDLAFCAVTGGTQELIHVSPRTGRAVSRAGGAEFTDRLLPLPQFLRDGEVVPDIAPDTLIDALRLTGHFLRHRLMPALNREDTPPARARLLEVLARNDGRFSGGENAEL